jgi:thiol:disulfide interchange protein DsbD
VKISRFVVVAGLLAIGALPATAQFGNIPKPSELVKVTATVPPTPAGGHARVSVRLHVREGWHVNANPAASAEAIPTTVTLLANPTATAQAPLYPSPHVVKLPIDEQPLKVWDGDVTVDLPFTVAAGASSGKHALPAELRIQACNDQICLPPATIAFTLDLVVVGAGSSAGASSGATASSAGSGVDSSAPRAAPDSSAAFATAPPAGGAASGAAATSSSPLAGLLARGGWVAFLSLFFIGLALNLTPCVYPMLGVTVSIFGARRAAPTMQVVGSALLYVLGMATMYSVLGVAAALTGSLFGGWLANPLVSIGIGALFMVLAFSMFGLYELTLPPALLSRLGGSGATSAIGIFASGLAVGIIAAPCVGPPVVALLAVVGQRGDPWFGFTSFFTLAMGLGAPYLVLGTFSNLIQRMPRSGDWMLWVKKVFGVILFSLGLNYALIAIAPALAGWVLPIGLMFGGLWLGIFDRTASAKPVFRGFKIVAGVIAMLGGFYMMSAAPKSQVTFEPLTSSTEALASGGQLAVVDFAADWCQPCHELERLTFSDRAVAAELQKFRRFKVDLTRYDSAESQLWKQRFSISGVPTMLFLGADGVEIAGTRVEGFVPPAVMLERIQLARAAAVTKR